MLSVPSASAEKKDPLNEKQCEESDDDALILATLLLANLAMAPLWHHGTMAPRAPPQKNVWKNSPQQIFVLRTC